MKFPQKAKIKVGAVTKRPFDLSCQVVTTHDFGYVKPVYVKNTVPSDTFKFNMEQFVRLSPLGLPTFGRSNIIYNAFYVPFYQVWSHFNDFYSNTKAVNASGVSTSQYEFPYFTAEQVFNFLKGKMKNTTAKNKNDITLFNYISVSHYDEHETIHEDRIGGYSGYTFGFGYDTSSSGGYITREDSVRAKRIYDLLLCLGYNIQPCYNFQETNDGRLAEGSYYAYTTGYDSENKFYAAERKLDATRLLAFVHVYLDWFESKQFTQDSNLRHIFEKIRDYNLGTKISDSDLSILFSSFNRCYEDDLFTSSYQYPEGANFADGNGMADTGVIPNYSNDDTSVNFENNSVFLKVKEARLVHEDAQISQQQLTLLQRIQQLFNRYRVGGQRDIDRYLAEFGVKSDDVDSKRSILCNSFSSEIIISDVMSTADTASETSGAILGEYAGRGLSYGKSEFTVNADDFGVIIVLCSIMPKTGYVYGHDKETEGKGIYDLFTPELDCVGMESVTFDQIDGNGFSGQPNEWFIPEGSSYRGRQAAGFIKYLGDIETNGRSIFGFVPRYSHMKVGNDMLTGDFRIGEYNGSGDMDSWHLFRQFPRAFGNNSFFRQVEKSSEDRIFQYDDPYVDHFFVFINWKVTALRPMLSISDSYDLLHPDDGHGHKEVTIDYNGKQL